MAKKLLISKPTLSTSEVDLDIMLNFNLKNFILNKTHISYILFNSIFDYKLLFQILWKTMVGLKLVDKIDEIDFVSLLQKRFQFCKL